MPAAFCPRPQMTDDAARLAWLRRASHSHSVAILPIPASSTDLPQGSVRREVDWTTPRNLVAALAATPSSSRTARPAGPLTPASFVRFGEGTAQVASPLAAASADVPLHGVAAIPTASEVTTESPSDLSPTLTAHPSGHDTVLEAALLAAFDVADPESSSRNPHPTGLLAPVSIGDVRENASGDAVSIAGSLHKYDHGKAQITEAASELEPWLASSRPPVSVRRSAVSLAYRFDEPVSLLGDGEEHRLMLASLQLGNAKLLRPPGESSGVRRGGDEERERVRPAAWPFERVRERQPGDEDVYRGESSLKLRVALGA
ncbi:hypothetical protein BD414DRAFT_181267 [Trametes punicea]|nr:hypothetical protein BD414DRAFT_181267 [Trametes punicea]